MNIEANNSSATVTVTDETHPVVAAFIAGSPNALTSRPFVYWHSTTEVWGESRVRYSWWAWLLAGIAAFAACVYATLFSTGVISFFLPCLVASCFAAMVLKSSARRCSFRADLARRTWTSTDEDFWRPVRAALKV